MNLRNGSKNTALISNGNFEDISLRPLNQHMVNVKKLIKITFLNFVNQLYEKNISLFICCNYVAQVTQWEIDWSLSTQWRYQIHLAIGM